MNNFDIFRQFQITWFNQTSNGKFYPKKWPNNFGKSKVPVIPPLPDDAPTYPDPNAPVAQCGECGRMIYRVEGYSCQNARCPVQMKATC